MSYDDIVAEYKSIAKQLTQAQKELQDIHGKIDSFNKELENINKQKQLANHDLKAHMDQIGVDMHRLEMVEALALTLKEAQAYPTRNCRFTFSVSSIYLMSRSSIS